MIDFRNVYKKLLKQRKGQNNNFVVKKKFDGMFVFNLVNNGRKIDLLYVLDTN